MATTTPPRQRLTRTQMRVMRRQFPVPQYVAPVSLKWRIVKATARGAWWLHKKGWARRRPLAPLYVATAVFVLGATAHHFPRGVSSVNAGSLAAAVAVGGWQWWANRCPRDRMVLSRWEWAYVVGVWASVSWWLNIAAIHGVINTGGVLAIILIAAWGPVAWRYAIRGDEPATVLTEEQKLWQDEAAASDGLAPRSEMHTPAPLDKTDPGLAWRARIELPKQSRVSASALLDKAEQIAMVYDRPISDIAVELVNGASPRWADLTVFTRNPLMDRVWWPGVDEVFNPESGVITVARYVTGGRAPYRQFRASGPVHDLIAGTTDAGKSGFINSLLAVERAHPLMASVVIDPQQGQSLPDWRGQVAVYAESIDEGRDVMVALRREMYRRNKILSDVEWIDEKGRARRGIPAFDINSQVIRDLNMPMICVTLEESGDALKDEVILDNCVRISTMARKCGIKLRLVAQVPLLDQLQSTVLRDMLVGGNVVVFRTANKLSGQVAFNGVLPADPSLLPREWPDGSTTAGVCYVLGPQAKPVIARTWPIQDTYHWATVGETTMLPELLTDTVEPLPVEAAAQVPAQRGGETAVARILAYLDEHEMSTAGVMARDLDIPYSTAYNTALRLEESGQIERLAPAKWGRLAERGEVAA